MAVLSTGQTFGATEQVTSTKLENIADLATFASGAVDGSSTALSSGAVSVKDGGITTAKIADDAVTPAKVDEDNDTQFVMKKIKGTVTQLEPYTANVSGAVSIDLDNGSFQVLTITGNVTSVAALSNGSSGQQFTIAFVDDGNAYTFADSWDSSWKWFGGASSVTTQTASAIDIVSGVMVGSSPCVTMLKNFA